MSLVSNKSQKVFLCLDTKINVDSKVDIILSPEFYWVRVFDLPVKNVSQAKLVLPTLFEDILESVEDLSYQVLKLEDGKYLCFAYVNKKIYEAIKSSGINLSLVNSVYFAQNECKNFKQFLVDEKAFIYTEDEILVKVPKNLLSEKIDLKEKLEEINLSSNRVDIKLYNNLLTSKQIYMILVACLILVFINVYKIFDFKSEISSLEQKSQKLQEQSSMPSSMLQTKSIISGYKKVVDLEVKKREALEYLLNHKSFKPTSVEIEKEKISLIYDNVDKKSIESYISKKYKIGSSIVRDLTLSVEVKL